MRYFHKDHMGYLPGPLGKSGVPFLAAQYWQDALPYWQRSPNHAIHVNCGATNTVVDWHSTLWFRGQERDGLYHPGRADIPKRLLLVLARQSAKHAKWIKDLRVGVNYRQHGGQPIDEK